MTFDNAQHFLKSWYQDDTLNDDKIRADVERWNRVLGNPAGFPNADVEEITRFDEAAATYLALHHAVPA